MYKTSQKSSTNIKVAATGVFLDSKERQDLILKKKNKKKKSIPIPVLIFSPAAEYEV